MTPAHYILLALSITYVVVVVALLAFGKAAKMGDEMVEAWSEMTCEERERAMDRALEKAKVL